HHRPLLRRHEHDADRDLPAGRQRAPRARQRVQRDPDAGDLRAPRDRALGLSRESGCHPMTTILSRRVASVRPPMTREMTRLGNEVARAGRSIMSLAQGEPDFDTPAHVREAGKAAIDAGVTRYTDVPGTRELTAAIIRKFERDNGLAFRPEQVTIGVGSK